MKGLKRSASGASSDASSDADDILSNGAINTRTEDRLDVSPSQDESTPLDASSSGSKNPSRQADDNVEGNGEGGDEGGDDGGEIPGKGKGDTSSEVAAVKRQKVEVRYEATTSTCRDHDRFLAGTDRVTLSANTLRHFSSSRYSALLTHNDSFERDYLHAHGE